MGEVHAVTRARIGQARTACAVANAAAAVSCHLRHGAEGHRYVEQLTPACVVGYMRIVIAVGVGDAGANQRQATATGCMCLTEEHIRDPKVREVRLIG